jgi:hypothetical protein
MVCVDALEGKLWIGKDGVWGNNGGIGNPALGLNPGASNLYTDTSFSYLPVMMGASDSGTSTTFWNFGQKPFKFPPPDGFQPLNDANVRPAKVISRPDQYVSITTWTGDGNDNRNITLMDGFDLLWYKQRSGTQYHYLEDTIRGASKSLFPNETSAESSYDSTKVKSFTKDGIVVGTDGAINQNTETYVAWTWRAGGRKNTFNVDGVGYASAADAGLSGGDRALTGCSVNTKFGFSILSWVNGTTTNPSSARVRHGLNQVPDLVIYKDRDSGSSQWAVKMETFSNPVRDELYLETNQAKTTAGVDLYFRDSDYIGHRETSIGSDGGKMIAYCWHNVPGLQKFGTYGGNSDQDGAFVHLGFQPALLWLKRTDSTGNWVILDSKRTPNNPANISAYADTNTDANYSPGQPWADILSNGFKLRATYGEVNVGDYIYCAWAEAPSVDLYGGGANAR